MNRDKAIKRLERKMKQGAFEVDLETFEALTISIEALEHFDILCRVIPAFRDAKLPSETEE